MNDSTNVEANSTALATDSRTIEESGANASALGRGVHLPEGEQKPEEHKPLSTRDAIAKAFDENTKAVEEKANAAAEAAKAKVDEAEAKEVKAERPRTDNGKFAKADVNVDAKADKGAPEQAASERVAPEDNRQSEGRKHSEPPARFLPEARTKWANVPNEVKGEFHRVSQEYEAEIARHKQSNERYEAVRQYDDTARANGRELKDSLAKVVEIEQAIARNPIAGLDAVLREIGPRKADGSPLTLLEVAQHIVQNPQAYHQSAMQSQMQQPQQQQMQQPSREIEELRAEIQSIKAQSIAPTIESFISQHPDYHTLEDHIISILKSGVIEQIYGQGLAPEQRLSEAYRMAGGRSPSRSDSEAVQQHSQPVQQARPVDPDGQKSIKGAPTNGKSAEPDKRFKSNREALEAAFAAHAR